jgi:hypothetical protein
MIFEVLVALFFRNQVFYDTKLCRLVSRSRHFEGTTFLWNVRNYPSNDIPEDLDPQLNIWTHGRMLSVLVSNLLWRPRKNAGQGTFTHLSIPLYLFEWRKQVCMARSITEAKLRVSVISFASRFNSYVVHNKRNPLREDTNLHSLLSCILH